MSNAVGNNVHLGFWLQCHSTVQKCLESNPFTLLYHLSTKATQVGANHVTGSLPFSLSLHRVRPLRNALRSTGQFGRLNRSVGQLSLCLSERDIDTSNCTKIPRPPFSYASNICEISIN